MVDLMSLDPRSAIPGYQGECKLVASDRKRLPTIIVQASLEANSPLPSLSASPEMQKGDPELARPGQVIPPSFEPFAMPRYRHAASVMRARVASEQGAGFTIGSGMILHLMARMRG